MDPVHRVINLHLLEPVLLHPIYPDQDQSHYSHLPFPVVILNPWMPQARQIMSRGSGVHRR